MPSVPVLRMLREVCDHFNLRATTSTAKFQELAKPGTVRLTVRVSALLDEKPASGRSSLPWSIEQARIAGTREVPVEVIVNGYPVARTNILADGKLRDVTLEAKIDRSSWVAMRILPSSHSNPIFVLVDGKPIRASKRSAEWCLKGVDQCWSQKERFLRRGLPGELETAKNDYDHAREIYRKLIQECATD